MLTMLNDSSNVKTVIKLLSQPQIGDDAAPSSSFISPFKNFDPSCTRTPRPEMSPASCTMPTASSSTAPTRRLPQVGAGTFWSQMTAWVGNQENISTALANIDQSWPTSGS